VPLLIVLGSLLGLIAAGIRARRRPDAGGDDVA